MIVLTSMEALRPEFPEPLRRANFSGGLGILIGEILWILRKCGIEAMGILPSYSRYRASDTPINYDSIAPVLFSLPCQLSSQEYVVNVRETNQNGTPIFNLECPPILDFLYTDNREQRLRQEALIGKVVPLLLKKLNKKPKILWFSESHTVCPVPHLREDSDFAGLKNLFTIHTAEGAGHEKFPVEWFDVLGANRERYYPVFVKNGTIDFAEAAMFFADIVNAVSQEHEQVIKAMFPDYAAKIISITNGASRDIWLSPRLKEAEGRINPFILEVIHQQDKMDFLDLVWRKTGLLLNPKEPLIGFVRRIVKYKNQIVLKPIIKAVCAEREEIVNTPFGPLEGLGMQVFCAGYASGNDEECCQWVNEFQEWTWGSLKGKFVFLPEYSFELLYEAAKGLDIGINSPLKKREACGASDKRWGFNGVPNLVTRSGGPAEWIIQFNPDTGQGNGFFIDPENPLTVYQALQTASQLYYNWQDFGDPTWLKLKMNSYQSGKAVDITRMINQYQEKVFAPLLSGSQ